MILTAEYVMAELSALLAVSPPFANGPGAIAVTDVSRISDGWETDVWSFTIRYETGGSKELILRIYQGQGAPAKAALEFQTMERLGEAGYPVPTVHLVAASETRFGGPFIIMDRIAGRSLALAYDEASQERKSELAALFVRLLANLHQLNWRPFATDPAQWELDDPSTRVRRSVDELRDLLPSFGSAQEAAPFIDWLDAHSRDVACETPAITHMDFHFSNILLREDDSVAVIDWSYAGVRDPRYDLAWTLLLMAPDPQSEFHRTLVATYEAMTGAPYRDRAYFEAWAVGRRLASLVIVWAHGGERLGMRPGLEEARRQQSDYIRSLAQRLQELTGITLPGSTRFL
jgi:aminoglycoside phosphotransferase (APT) family kinase protein